VEHGSRSHSDGSVMGTFCYLQITAATDFCWSRLFFQQQAKRARHSLYGTSIPSKLGRNL
jgi:hypothetical protein